MQAGNSTFSKYFDSTGARIKAIRELRGFKQADLGFPAGTVSGWESGEHEPTKPRLEGIASKLGVSTGFLYTGNPMYPADFDVAEKLGVSERNDLDMAVGEETAGYNLKTDRHRVNILPPYEITAPPKNIVDAINAHLSPWIDSAKDKPEIAGHVLSTLRLHLPHSALEQLKNH